MAPMGGMPHVRGAVPYAGAYEGQDWEDLEAGTPETPSQAKGCSFLSCTSPRMLPRALLLLLSMAILVVFRPI